MDTQRKGQVKTLTKYFFIFLMMIAASYIGITVFYNLPALIAMSEDR